ncbi:MAG: CapA family protein [Acetivibrionales bacterium]
MENIQNNTEVATLQILSEEVFPFININFSSTDDALNDTAINEQSQTITISFAGDCTIGSDESYKGHTFHKVYQEVNDPAYFFRNVNGIFANDDYTLINLEGTFTNEKKKAAKEFRYKGPPEYCEILHKGGIDGVTLANNHTLDYLKSGYDETVKTLKEWGIDYTNFDTYFVKHIKGLSIGFLGYKAWSHEKYSNDLLVKHIKEMQEQGVDYIIVNYHWGDMYSYIPNAQQKRMAHFAIDHGADLVIGHHPHVLQGMETYKEKNIVYSLGNFCYGGKMNPKDKDTIIFQQLLTYNASENRITAVEYRIIPASISSKTYINDFQPVPVSGKEGERIIEKYRELSDKIK